jgi:hypothetical protein
VPTAALPAAAAPADAQADPAVAGEARARDAGAVSAAIVRRQDLDVFALPSAIRLLVLDADVRKVDLVIEVRQVVLISPLANLIGRAIGMSVVVVVVLVALVEPALILALELVVENGALDVRAALQQTLLGLFVRAIDLEVVFEFPFAPQARVERLRVLVIGIAVALEEGCARPSSGSPHGRGTLARAWSRSTLVRAGVEGRRTVDQPGSHRGLGGHDWRPLGMHQRSRASGIRSRARCIRDPGRERVRALVREAGERGA